MTTPKPLGEAIADHFAAQHAEATARPFVEDPSLEALSARLVDMQTAAPSMYAAHPERERVERYRLAKLDHAAGRSRPQVVTVFGGGR